MSTARSGAWLLLDTLSAAVIAFAFFVISARILSPEDFGVAVLAVSVAQIMQPLIESLFHDALIQREDLRDEDIAVASTANILWAVVIALGVALLARPIATLTHAPALAGLLPWLGCAAIAGGTTAVPVALARRRMAFRELALRTIAARTLATVVGIAMLWRGYGPAAVVMQAVLAIVLSSAFVLIIAPPPLRLSLRRDRLIPLLRFAAPAMGTQLLLFASSRLITIVISALLGPRAAGLWGVALRFAEPVQTMAATTIGQFTLPLYARRQASMAEMRAMYAAASRRVSLLLVPTFVGMGACAPIIIELFLGDEWREAAPLMAITCIVLAIVASRQLIEIALTAGGAPHLNFIVQLAAILLSLGGTIIGARWGLLGAALGWALRALPFVTVAAVFLRQRLSLGYGLQARELAPVFLAAGVMSSAVTWVRMAAGGALPPALLLALCIITGGFAYVATILALVPAARAEISMLRARRASGV